ncbi:fimbrial protein [Stenotrophomonas maltophilia]|uniref:fimbrial protein n=1 Tax=Stenotrophomonas maltophilia group sp. Smal13 TaxID=3377166 RepID=UPI001310D8E3|nr:fimbrial protein [Stenotrophomonas maltophilia]EKU9960290.1 type 1 fimbrial protein [Stenotrophomonas maltophilia]EKU9984020.1 type 1 fimbrial protein [Stenotrophomonas maltophilia]
MNSKRSSRARGHLLMLLGLAVLGASGDAAARCDKYSNASHSTGDATLTANGIAVDRFIGPWQVGTSDYTGGCSASFGGPTMTLTANAKEVGVYRVSAKEIYSIYDSGVPGIGYIVGFRGELRGGGYQAVRNGMPVEDRNPDREEIAYTEMRERYIKIGATTAGTYTTTPLLLGTLHVNDGTSVSYDATVTIESATLEIVHRPVCYPQPKKVSMGSTPLTDFSGQYSGGRKRGFLIEIECDEKVGEIDYYLEGTVDSPAVDVKRGIVDVSGGATGVGLQMMENDSVIPLETTRHFGSNWTGGRVSRHFYARYVQTAAKVEDVVPGTANAAIRIGMDYP